MLCRCAVGCPLPIVITLVCCQNKVAHYFISPPHISSSLKQVYLWVAFGQSRKLRHATWCLNHPLFSLSLLSNRLHARPSHFPSSEQDPLSHEVKMVGNSGNKGGGGSNGFKALGLSEEVYKGIVRMGFRVRRFLQATLLFERQEAFSHLFPQMPTPVQRKALPVVLTGSDACVMVSLWHNSSGLCSRAHLM